MSKAQLQKARKLQRRRLRAGRLLTRGVAQAEVARRVGASRTTVSAWNRELEAKGLEGLRARPRGRPSGLSHAQRGELLEALLAGALAEGLPTDLWTLSRVGALIERRFGRRYSESQVWRILVALGFSCQRPSSRALERNEGAIRRWKRSRWPVLKKNAAKQGRLIVFIDESGLSERPTRVRTWAPKGQTPVLQYHFNWHQLSVDCAGGPAGHDVRVPRARPAAHPEWPRGARSGLRRGSAHGPTPRVAGAARDATSERARPSARERILHRESQSG
jgi:transposase